MAEKSRCPECGADLPKGETKGLCPKCLMGAGLGSEPELQQSDHDQQTTSQPGGFAPPNVESLAPHFPHLEILHLIGHGGMGAVYKAHQKKLDRLVALKIIRPESADDPAFAERFNREAKMLARLNHPNIVGVHDFGEVTLGQRDDAVGATLFYFLMEYVDGANLRHLIASQELTPERALAIVPQICESLQFAHDEGVVHRDIKPENILIDSKGRVKIADFGLAKLSERSAEDFTLTGTHQVMGTPRYMAPEQMNGSHDVDHRADIYSLGVVFYEMLTGQIPAGHFEPPSKKVRVDVRLDEVVLRSLAHEPERRYQQASEIRTDVDAISRLNAAEESMDSMAVRIANTAEPGHTKGRLGRFLSSATGWIIVLAMLGGLSVAFQWVRIEHVVAGGTEYGPKPGVLFFAVRGIQSIAGWIVVGSFAVLVSLLVIDGVNVRPTPAWRPLITLLVGFTVLAVIGLYLAGPLYENVSPKDWVKFDGRSLFSADATVRMLSSQINDRTRITLLPAACLTIACAFVVIATAIGQLVTTFLPTTPRPRDRTLNESRLVPETLKPTWQLLQGPSQWLFITSILNWIGIPLGAAITALVIWNFGSERTIRDEDTWTGLMNCVFLLPFNAVIMVAALKLRDLHAFWLGVAGSTLAMVVPPGLLLGFPVGVWMLVLLMNRRVRDAFSSTRKAELSPDKEHRHDGTFNEAEQRQEPAPIDFRADSSRR